MDQLGDLATLPQSILDDVKTTLHNASEEIWKTKMNEVVELYKSQLSTGLGPVLREIEQVLLKSLQHVEFDVSPIQKRKEEEDARQEEEKEKEKEKEKDAPDEAVNHRADQPVDLLKEYNNPVSTVVTDSDSSATGSHNFLVSLLAGAKDILRIQVDKRVQEFVDRQFKHFQENFEKDMKDRLVQATEEFFTNFFLAVYKKSQQKQEIASPPPPPAAEPAPAPAPSPAPLSQRGGSGRLRKMFSRKRHKSGPETQVRLY